MTRGMGLGMVEKREESLTKNKGKTWISFMDFSGKIDGRQGAIGKGKLAKKEGKMN